LRINELKEFKSMYLRALKSPEIAAAWDLDFYISWDQLREE
jgi:hypothetical protein